jgi:hypothetical protein
MGERASRAKRSGSTRTPRRRLRAPAMFGIMSIYLRTGVYRGAWPCGGGPQHLTDHSRLLWKRSTLSGGKASCRGSLSCRIQFTHSLPFPLFDQWPGSLRLGTKPGGLGFCLTSRVDPAPARSARPAARRFRVHTLFAADRYAVSADSIVMRHRETSLLSRPGRQRAPVRPPIAGWQWRNRLALGSTNDRGWQPSCSTRRAPARTRFETPQNCNAPPSAGYRK